MAAVIIALTGKAGAGKSTASEILARGWGFERVRFADPLKTMMRSLYRDAGLEEGEIERRIEGDLKEVPCDILRGKTPRQAMQWLGTEWGRDLIAPDFWVSLWALRAQAHRFVVAEDCRFENEASMVRRHGGLVVQIDRPSGIGAISNAGHASESGLKDFDGLIRNDGTLKDLEHRINEIAMAAIGGF